MSKVIEALTVIVVALRFDSARQKNRMRRRRRLKNHPFLHLRGGRLLVPLLPRHGLQSMQKRLPRLPPRQPALGDHCDDLTQQTLLKLPQAVTIHLPNPSKSDRNALHAAPLLPFPHQTTVALYSEIRMYKRL